EPMVAGAWMGLAVKTDGAAVASGAIAESLILAKASAQYGINYQPGWIMATTTTVKVFIDVFIAIWAFILAWIWSTKIERREGEKIRIGQIWERFPKFILGYMATFFIVILLAFAAPDLVKSTKSAMGEANVFRGIFFVMTFFTIGVSSNFRRLWTEGIGKLALVYLICLFGFIIWIGLFISWLFFNGVKPPIL
ncbi:MAG: putative sulfate exporter family transporter, partial [Candidatus Zixiibacteriota bacterium]